MSATIIPFARRPHANSTKCEGCGYKLPVGFGYVFHQKHKYTKVQTWTLGDIEFTFFCPQCKLEHEVVWATPVDRTAATSRKGKL